MDLGDMICAASPYSSVQCLEWCRAAILEHFAIHFERKVLIKWRQNVSKWGFQRGGACDPDFKPDFAVLGPDLAGASGGWVGTPDPK